MWYEKVLGYLHIILVLRLAKAKKRKAPHGQMRVPYSNHIICPSVCLSIRPSTLSLCCNNLNTILQRNFKLCIWVIYQIRRTPIVFWVITSKVKVTGNFFGIFTFLSFMLHWAAIIGILFCREFSNLVRIFVWVRFEYGSSGVCLSIFLSTLSLCCNNWNTFPQRTFKLCQNVRLDKILVKFEYGSSGVCLSIRLFICLSVRPHFLCAAITGILFYREFSNFVYG